MTVAPAAAAVNRGGTAPGQKKGTRFAFARSQKRVGEKGEE